MKKRHSIQKLKNSPIHRTEGNAHHAVGSIHVLAQGIIHTQIITLIGG